MIMARVFANCVGDQVQSQVDSYQRLKKWYLMAPYLTFSIIRYGSRVKWSNLGNGVVLSLLHLSVVAVEKGAFGSPSTMVTNFTLLYLYWGRFWILTIAQKTKDLFLCFDIKQVLTTAQVLVNITSFWFRIYCYFDYFENLEFTNIYKEIIFSLFCSFIFHLRDYAIKHFINLASEIYYQCLLLILIHGSSLK